MAQLFQMAQEDGEKGYPFLGGALTGTGLQPKACLKARLWLQEGTTAKQQQGKACATGQDPPGQSMYDIMGS